jgi:hypothetical protein
MTIYLHFEQKSPGALHLKSDKNPDAAATVAAVNALFASIKEMNKAAAEKISNIKEFTAALTGMPDSKTITVQITGKVNNVQIVINVGKLKPETAQFLPPSLVEKIFSPGAHQVDSKPNIPTTTPVQSLLIHTFPMAMVGPSLFTYQSALANPQIEALKPPGITNPSTNCFMNATFQMVMNDEVLCQALVETFTEALKKCEAEKVTISSNRVQLDQELEALKKTQGWWYTWTAPYRQWSERDQKNNSDLEKCEKHSTAYQHFLNAVNIYKTGGKEKIDLTPLRYLLKIYRGSRPGGMGDAEEFFNALFYLVDLRKHQIGFCEGYERTYARLDPNSELAEEYTPERWSKIKKDDLITLQEGNKRINFEEKREHTPTLAFEFQKNKTGQKLLDELLTPQDANGEPIGCQDGYYLLQTEKRIFEQLPQRFMVHLKRFTYNAATGAPEKIDDELPMSQVVTIQEQDYLLRSIVYHVGAAHYVAYINKKGVWYKANDSVVTVANDLQTGLKYGYLYFYEKVPALSPVD